MKKLILALLILNLNAVDTIFNEIFENIITARSFEYGREQLEKPDPQWELDTFLNSQKAQRISAQIQCLSQNDKLKLIQQFNNPTVS